MEKIVVLDFDGVFSATMLYDNNGKALKSFPWGIRYAIDELNKYGFEVYIITGDSTGNGVKISKKFTENLKIKEFISCSAKNKLDYILNRFGTNIYYSGDDIYDLSIFSIVHGITNKNAIQVLKNKAKYVSEYTTYDYYMSDLASYIISNYFGVHKIQVQTQQGMSPIYKNVTSMLSYLVHGSDSEITINIAQQYSMRSHDTGLYNIMLDGNFNLTLSRLYEISKNNKVKKIKISAPNNRTNDDFFNTINEQLFNNKIELVNYEYGINAMDNMKKFANSNNAICGLMSKNRNSINLSYFPLKQNDVDIVYLFNISKVDGLVRDYIDTFYDKQLEIVNNTDSKVYVLNENQRLQFIKDTNKIRDNKNFMTYNNVVTDNHYFNVEFYSNLSKLLLSGSNENELDALYGHRSEIGNTYFFPFRLSDKAYDFKGLLELSDKNDIILVTDPNDSLNEFDTTGLNVIKLCPTEKYNSKHILNYILKNSKNMYLYLNEDFETVAHQTLIEIFNSDMKIIFSRDFLNHKGSTYLDYNHYKNNILKTINYDKII